MRELRLEIPLLEMPFADAAMAQGLESLLKGVDMTYLLRLRGEGFLMICRVARDSELLNDPSIAMSLGNRINVKTLSIDKSGASVLQIAGTWSQLFAGSRGEESAMARFMDSLRGKPIYITKNPDFHDRRLHIYILGEEGAIADLLEDLKRLAIPIKVSGLGVTKAHRESPLSNLTERQAGILKLAYSLGYYEIPKKTRVEDIARILGIDKGTAGEHLQRAEKHVFDWLLR